ncbi:MAG: hypothetical protein ACD_56C00141G0004 [uncultured bacterium]|nr:MAG: hypothetical protein ACD_56C00141G0004 [uncultured bacterium]
MKKQKTAKKIKPSVKAKKTSTIKKVKVLKSAKSLKVAVKTAKATRRIRRVKKDMLSLGNIKPGHGRVLLLLLMVIGMLTYMTVSRLQSLNEVENVPAVQTVQPKEKSPLEKGIAEMVDGYPIEKMMPYILKQNPKTAMFLVAIAKKESAWGKRKPVLDGQDCYNYWGFRLKAEKMGSGGHTCFDTPKEAVETVAERIDQLVIEEDIDTPSDMIVWKCGYGCQDQPKSISEKKWINDVDFYYSAMNEYL